MISNDIAYIIDSLSQRYKSLFADFIVVRLPETKLSLDHGQEKAFPCFTVDETNPILALQSIARILGYTSFPDSNSIMEDCMKNMNHISDMITLQPSDKPYLKQAQSLQNLISIIYAFKRITDRQITEKDHQESKVIAHYHLQEVIYNLGSPNLEYDTLVPYINKLIVYLQSRDHNTTDNKYLMRAYKKAVVSVIKSAKKIKRYYKACYNQFSMVLCNMNTVYKKVPITIQRNLPAYSNMREDIISLIEGFCIKLSSFTSRLNSNIDGMVQCIEERTPPSSIKSTEVSFNKALSRKT